MYLQYFEWNSQHTSATEDASMVQYYGIILIVYITKAQFKFDMYAFGRWFYTKQFKVLLSINFVCSLLNPWPLCC